MGTLACDRAGSGKFILLAVAGGEYRSPRFSARPSSRFPSSALASPTRYVRRKEVAIMPRLFTFLLGMVAGALLCYAASNYHVVRANDTVHFVQKVRPGFADTYVDVRAFGVGDWANHPDLAAALAHQNKQHVMEGAATNSIQASVNQYLPNWPQQ
jgi:hypothetical protein